MQTVLGAGDRRVCGAVGGLDFDEVLRIAVSHSGNSVVTGALAGAIGGASFEGLGGIPAYWAEGLSMSAKLVFRLSQDVPEQLREFPRDDDEWDQRFPLLSRPGCWP
ncbi:hypothetical protein REH65_19685 [Saccharopolyspora sp. ID03-671]|uniref:hypothetical protein n=1 Tax=Saccharopolyspora sp. ID03-671 TaxID=3073066 RepID=UPI003247C8DC